MLHSVELGDFCHSFGRLIQLSYLRPAVVERLSFKIFAFSLSVSFSSCLVDSSAALHMSMAFVAHINHSRVIICY